MEMWRKRIGPVAAWAGVLLVSALALAKDAAPAPFKKGDTVCVIGDSITHGGRYITFISLFYATRFPDEQIPMYNCGISGDSAAGAVRRFEWDIAVHKPTVATILLGMNDVGRSLYGKDKVDAQSKQRQKAQIDGHVKSMTELAELLKKAKCKMIFLTPTIYEQNADTGSENFFGVNDGLGVCGEEAKKLAKKSHGSVVDVHAVMNEINEKAQQKDPSFTLVGKDRVHPGDVGHFVMAYAVLKAQGISPCVAKMKVDAKTGKVEEANCKISEVKAAAEEVAFDCLEGALPYPVPESAKPALELVPFEAELNQETLIVGNLASGQYELSIDNEAVGEFSAEELKAGVNLASIAETPQYQQAVEVDKLNSKMRSLESSRLRTFAAVRHGTLSRANVDPDDLEAAKKALLATQEKLKGTPYYEYNKRMMETYLQYKPMEKDILKEIEETSKAIYTTNQPKPHHYALKKK